MSDIQIMSLVLNKRKTQSLCKQSVNDIYNFLLKELVKSLINNNIFVHIQNIRLIIDKKDTNKNLDKIIVSTITKVLTSHWDGEFQIVLERSENSKELQVVDFIAWAIFRKYELGDYRFYDLIKDHIVGEYLL